MSTSKTADATAAYERSLARAGDEQYVLCLYVTGMTPRSLRAVANIKEICKEHLEGRCTLQVVDINQQPRLIDGEQIIAVPTLIKRLPAPLRRVIGDLSDREKVLIGLDLRPKK